MLQTRTLSGVFFHEPDPGSLSQAPPILGAHEELRAQGIALRSRAGFLGPGSRKLLRDSDDFLILTHDGKASPDLGLVPEGLPVLVLARGASSSVSLDVGILLGENCVAALIRNTNLAELERNRRVSSSVTHRYHVRMLLEDEGITDFSAREDHLSRAMLSKIRTGFNLCTYPRLNQVAAGAWNPVLDRPLDASFVGKANHGIEAIERHRHRAVGILARMSPTFSVHVAVTKTESVKGYTKKRFYELLRQSKATVSPWGFGEMCIRDFEAILAGAVLIKPDMDHVVTSPDVYIKNETYLPCRRDFADLPDIVDDVRRNWIQYRALREHAYRVVMESRKPESIAAQVSALIRQGLQEPAGARRPETRASLVAGSSEARE